MVFSKFLNVEQDKQERIINASLKEFAQKGYTQASTNEMVKEAGISKGLLFHYFNSKQDLYLFLYDYSVDLIMNEMKERLDWNERDFFVKWKEIVLLKIELARKYPDIFNFLQVSMYEETVEIKRELEQRNRSLMADAYAELFKEIDFSLFKDGIEVGRAMNIVIWTMEGFGNQEQEKLRIMPLDQSRMEEIVVEMDRYLTMLRQMFYK